MTPDTKQLRALLEKKCTCDFLVATKNRTCQRCVNLHRETAYALPGLLDAADENAKLREVLAFAYSGAPNLYADDGELTDNTIYPYIDYRRDSVEEIKRKIAIRGINRLIPTKD